MTSTKRSRCPLDARVLSRSAIAAFLLVAPLSLTATGSSEPPMPASSAVAAQSNPSSETTITDETPILSRGGVTVTIGDLRDRAYEIPNADRAAFFASRRRLDDTIRQILETKQLAAEARRLGLDRTPEFLAAVRLGTERTLANLYNRAVQEQAVESADLDQLARERFLTEATEPGWFIEVRHILIRPGADRTEALAKAVELRNRVVAGESIAELAQTYSEDEGSKGRGGLIEGRADLFDRAFAAAAVNLEKPGDVAPVTESAFGFHVIQLVSKRQVDPATFEERRERLLAEVADSVARRQLTATHERLFAADIELNEAAIEWLMRNPDAFTEKR